MRRSVHPLAWLPPLAVGASAAVAGELSVALLLYTAAGFLEALTVILVVELGALGLGLWSAPAVGGFAWEAVRRRWLLALVAFAVAAGAAAGWEIMGGLASPGLLRGIGLALLAALPIYAAGTLLGVMAAVRRDDAVRSPVGAPAVLGAAAGAALTGFVGPRLPPVSAYLSCVVLLSAASLVHGRVLDRRTRRRVLERAASPRGALRVEERIRGRRRDVVVLEGDVVRGGRDDAGRPLRAWETAVARLLESDGAPPSLLIVGAGAAAVSAMLPPGGELTVAEPDPVFARLVSRYLARDGTAAAETDPCDLLEGMLPAGAWGTVVVDATAWAGREPVPRLPRRTMEALARSLRPGGLLVLGGIRLAAAHPIDPTGPTDPGLVELVARSASAGLGGLAVYVHEAGGGEAVATLRRGAGPTAFDDPPAPPGWRRVESRP